jgi:hypothetical protein
MFHFSIRELMLVTLVVGLVIGWLIDHRKLSQEVAEAKEWRTCAGALEHALDTLGWTVEWDLRRSVIRVSRRDKESPGNFHMGMSSKQFEPSPLYKRP